MTYHVTTQSEIPDAPCYVCATDTFQSRGIERHKPGYYQNRVILPCASVADAFIVEQNANDRTDMQRVTICTRKPTLRRGTYYQVMEADECQRWHERGGFANLRR